MCCSACIAGPMHVSARPGEGARYLFLGIPFSISISCLLPVPRILLQLLQYSSSLSVPTTLGFPFGAAPQFSSSSQQHPTSYFYLRDLVTSPRNNPWLSLHL